MTSYYTAIGWLFTLVTLVASSAKWTYSGENGPSHWKFDYMYCDDSSPDSRQSPVNIQTTEVEYNSSLRAVKYINYEIENSGVNFELWNNERTVVVTPKFQDGEKIFPKVEYQPVGETPSQYKLVQLNFHWGSNNSVGSEHTINGKHYQVEVHFVHMNMKYQNFDVAMEAKDGLLVIGTFLQATNTKNHTGYQSIATHLKYVKNSDPESDSIEFQEFLDAVFGKGVMRTIPSFALNNLLPTKTNQVYFYEGSLTTPGCFESVKWFVNNDVIDISPWQMDQFLTLFGDNQKQLVNNFRPVQKLQNRVIHTNVNPDVSSAANLHLSFWLFTLVLAVYLSQHI